MRTDRWIRWSRARRPSATPRTALSAEKLERLLNDEAQHGWRLKAIISTEVKGRIGPGGVEGLLLTLERPTS